MKLAVLSPDASGRIDPSIGIGILKHIPQVSLHDSDAVIVPIAYMADFVFNPKMNSLVKPVILCDFLEFGWDAGERENRLGRGALKLTGHFSTPEWEKLDAWACDHPPALTFKRELLARDRSDTMLPIIFACSIPASPIPSRTQFNSRPFETFHCWGYSSPTRPRLHADTFKAMADMGINIISDWCQFENMPQSSRTWVSIYSPYWARQHIRRIMDIQRQSKISVSLPGAGRVCFRSSESPVDCIMAIQDDGLTTWPFPWDGTNSIPLKAGGEFQSLYDATERADLYELMIASQVTIDRYRSVRFVEEYVLPSIKTIL